MSLSKEDSSTEIIYRAAQEIEQLKSHVKLLRRFLKHLGSLGFYERNSETGEVTPNHFWESCGYRAEDLVGDAWLSLVHPEDLPDVRSVFGTKTELLLFGASSKSGTSPDIFELEYRVRTSDGSWRWVLNRGIVLARSDEGRILQCIGIDLDITARKEAENELRLQREHAEQRALEAETLRVVGAVVASELNPQETIQRILIQAALVVPYERATVYRLQSEGLVRVGETGSRRTYGLESSDDSGIIRMTDSAPHMQVLHEGQPLIFNRVHELFAVRHLDGVVTKSWLGVPLVLRGELMGMLCFESTLQGFFNDSHMRMGVAFADSVAISLENSRLYEDVRQLAFSDELTGLYTRRWMQEFALRQIDQALRSGSDLSLLMIDIDRFKTINDTFGHQVGDLVLREVAAVCARELRAGDLICRWGGEEFLVLLPDIGAEEAHVVAERIRASVEKCRSPMSGKKKGKEPDLVTVSIGIGSLQSLPQKSFEDLLGASDKAMYVAKRAGRNRVIDSE